MKRVSIPWQWSIQACEVHAACRPARTVFRPAHSGDAPAVRQPLREHRPMSSRCWRQVTRKPSSFPCALPKSSRAAASFGTG